VGPVKVDRFNFESIIKETVKEFGEGWIILLDVRPEKYNEANMTLLRLLANKLQYAGIIIDLNRPFKNLLSFLEHQEIDYSNMHFIDAISREVGAEIVQQENVTYVSGPQGLTEICIEFGKTVPKLPVERKFAFLDSLTALTIYNNVKSVAKFSHFITAKMRMLGVSGVMISISEKTNETLYDALAQVCDRVIKL
jgi:hypothetical protein